jgi:hypothetical protein
MGAVFRFSLRALILDLIRVLRFAGKTAFPLLTLALYGSILSASGTPNMVPD